MSVISAMTWNLSNRPDRVLVQKATDGELSGIIETRRRVQVGTAEADEAQKP
jgi:hypothetical protein